MQELINEGCIPFIIKATNSTKKEKVNKMEAYKKLKYLKKTSPIVSEIKKERS